MLQPWFEEFKRFVKEMDFLGGTVGVIIAVTVQEFVKSLVANIVFPLIMLGLVWFSWPVKKQNLRLEFRDVVVKLISLMVAFISMYGLIKVTFKYFYV